MFNQANSVCGQAPLNWLITGGCGFIGTSLIKHLLAEGGHNILVLDNLSVGSKEALKSVSDFVDVTGSKLKDDVLKDHPNLVKLIIGDILDENLALQVTEDIDVIVHLAANTGVEPSVKNPRQDFIANALGTFNYLEGARKNKVKRFIFASSGAPIGDCEPPIHEEKVPHPVSPYGASKLAGEAYCSAYFKTFGLKTIALRFGNVYGPGSGHKQSVVAKFIKQAIEGEVLEVYGDGTQTRDFVYIMDLVQAIQKAAICENIGGEVFQIATNRETTLIELVERLLPILDRFNIGPVSVINSEKRIGDVMRNYSDTTKANKILGWHVSTDLLDGLCKTVDYFITQHT